VIVLTTFDLDEYVYKALRVGASAFLLKDAPEDQLVAAIRVAADGGRGQLPWSLSSSLALVGSVETCRQRASLVRQPTRRREQIEPWAHKRKRSR